VEYGPVDIVVVAMGEPRFDGSIMAELERLAATGTIRVLDAMVLVNDENGEQWTLDIEDMPQEDQDALGFIDTGTRGLFDGEDAALMFEGMVPGSAVVALAIENAWAVPMINAIQESGADVALHTRIPGPIVDDALAILASDAE
jgi:hypothetical protein